MSELRSILEQVYEAYAGGDLEGMARNFAPDCEMVFPGMPTTVGVEHLKAFIGSQMRAYSNARHTVRRTVEEGNTIAAELTFTGIHSGPLPGPVGEIAPTNRDVRVESCDVVTIEAGRITSWRVYLDTAGMLAQLGLMLSPATA